MRVFCPEHKRGFFAPRQSPIKCENRGHVLGEINFAGEAGDQVELQWQYCCNCEHFCPISPEGETLDRCPVCTRRTSLLYICDRCFTVSFESNTPLGTKNFTITSEGLPQPSCPACLQTNSGEVREHACDQLGASFTTALNACPICGERLDIGPAFPMLLAQYLRRIKTANKVNVTFDYDTGLFVPVEDGEFVLITNSADKQAIVLPRLPRFSNTREFYEIYQDYYHYSAELKPGEVCINEPAVAERSGEGWQFQSPGLLEVVDAQPKIKPRNKIRLGEIEPAEPVHPAPAVTALPRNRIRPDEIETPAHEQPAPPSAARLKEKMRLSEFERPQPPAPTPATEDHADDVCNRCGEVVEARYAFCWHCGNPMRPSGGAGEKRASSAGSPRRLVIDVDDASTVDPDRESRQASAYSPNLSKPKKVSRGGNSALKLMLVVIIAGGALVAAMTGVFWIRGWGSTANSPLVAQAATTNLQSGQSLVPTVEASDKPVAEPTQQAAPVARPGEDELRKLRQRRVSATAADRPAMLRDFSRAERQFAGDYRFPYERAKLALVGPQAKSLEAAFQALSLAAEKAIRMGQAQEMLRNLEADKNGDFRKLSHGHPEWSQLVQALKSRDMKFLTANNRSRQAE